MPSLVVNGQQIKEKPREPHFAPILYINPSCTKPLILTPYIKGGGGGGGGVGPIPCYLKSLFPHKHEILYAIGDIFEGPRNVKVSYLVIN